MQEGHVKMKAKIEVMHLKAKDQGLQAATRS